MPYLPLLVLLILTACSGDKNTTSHTMPAPDTTKKDSTDVNNIKAQQDSDNKAAPLNLALPNDVNAARKQGSLPQQQRLPSLFDAEESAKTTLKAKPKLQFEEGSNTPQLDGAEVEIKVPLN